MTGNKKALAKKGALITETRDHSQKDIKVNECPNAQKLRTDTIAYTSYFPSSEAVTKFHVNSGCDFLVKCLYHIGLFDCTLCDQRQYFAQHLLLMCTALSSKA